jgi:hypothetical protein
MQFLWTHQGIKTNQDEIGLIAPTLGKSMHIFGHVAKEIPRCQSSSGSHLRHLRERERITDVPVTAPNDNDALLVAPLEWIRKL